MGIIVVILFIGLIVFGILITVSNDFYCAIALRKERKLWKYFFNNVRNFKYEYTYKPGIVFTFKEFIIVYWEDGTTSVHLLDNCKCILSGYDEKMSRGLAEKISLYFPEISDMPDCISN